MPSFDFDFQRYVELRKGSRERQSREGAGYAYAGGLKLLRTLEKIKPVRVALEGAVKLWRGSARAELLGPAVKVTETREPKVFAAAKRCAERLHIEVPTVYVTPGAIAGGLVAYTFGTDDDPAILLHAGLVESLPELELLDVVGRECGHVQNNHVLYRTALYFLVHASSTLVRWGGKPAVAALGNWHRGAEVTGDRAGLICSRDLEASERALLRVAQRGPIDPGRSVDEQLSPEVKGRVAALRLFAAGAYYGGLSGGAATGPSADETDRAVGEVLA